MSSPSEPSSVKLFEPTILGAPRTLAEIMLIQSDYAQTVSLYNLAAGVSRDDLERLLEEAARFTQISERRAATSILYERYAELDPRAAVDFILRRGNTFAGRWIGRIFHAWSRQDLSAAVSHAAKLAPPLKSIAGAALLKARDDLPPDELREIAESLGILRVMEQMELQRQFDLADNDPRDAWQSALETKNLQFRLQYLHRVAATWTRTDPIAAMEAVVSVTDVGLRNNLQRQILQQWAQHSPQEATDWAFAQPPSKVRTNLLSSALASLAGTEPREAMYLAQGLSGNERREVISHVLQSWSSNDPRAAAQWFESAGESLRQTAAYSVASAYAQQYPDEAFDWATSLPATQSQMASLAVLTVIAQSDSRYAGRLINRLPDPAVRINAAKNIIQQWARTDPRAAGAWIEGFDDGEHRKQLYSSLLRQWGQIDPNEALNYLDRIPAGRERDAAIFGVISNSYNNVALAESAFKRIENVDQRRVAAQQLYRILLKTDPTRADRYRVMAGIEIGAEVGTDQIAQFPPGGID